MASSYTQALRSAGTYAYQNRAKIASTVGSLMSKVKAYQRANTPAVAIRGTRLKSYLDKTYEKKCGTEVKQFLSADTAAAPGTTLATLISPFQNIAQGLTDATRLGNSIEVKRLQVLLNLNGHATLPCRVRIIVLKQSVMQGSVPAVADVLEVSTNIRSFYALDNDASYTILKDVTFDMTPLSTNDALTQKTWRFNYKPKGCHLIRYTQADTTGAIADMIHGNINIKIMYEGGAPTGSFTFKAEWVDL